MVTLSVWLERASIVEDSREGGVDRVVFPTLAITWVHVTPVSVVGLTRKVCTRAEIASQSPSCKLQAAHKWVLSHGLFILSEAPVSLVFRSCHAWLGSRIVGLQGLVFHLFSLAALKADNS